MISKFIGSSRYAVKYTDNCIYIAPHELLKPYISHYRISFPNNSVIPEVLTIIPDASGCLVFTVVGNTLESLLWGATTETVIVKNDVNHCPMRLFIEFLPQGLFYFTGITQSDLTDIKLPLWQVNRHLYSQVERAFEVTSNLDDFIEVLNKILLPYIQEKERLPVLLAAIEQLKRSSGTITVNELSNITYYSERHLNRIFKEYVGTSVKTFSRIIRINTSIEKMKEQKSILTVLAQDIGFFDQSHFIRDFKSVCGVTPKDYALNMSDFYNEGLKF
ncbi:helix-turn-helix domain-containing protein [Pseudobacteroides cellulosolvens]|uniref:helix-turn-helix domain-containing protein n=1 Tax=Pseudobacteroides cellulosolvens TaxID=35825 RepID=UPI0006813333|nr:helix-turn-helix transcriptional regulator [Pseudobacteroides cellulosolvens]